MPETGRLIISYAPNSVMVEGVVGASPDLMSIVGTVKEAAAPVIDDVDDLERAIVEAAQSGTKVMDGYVKFAFPIQIKYAPSIGTVKEAYAPVATLNDNGLMNFIGMLSTLKSTDDAEGIEKLAACDFVNNWCDKMELDKVDGSEVGIKAPVKVAFKDDATKAWFLSLFDKKAQQEKAAAVNLAELLMERGIKTADALDALAKVASKRQKRRS